MSKQPAAEFIRGFVEACYDSGMSKEGAAVMLHRHYLKEAMKDEAFAAGFTKAAAAAPGYYSANEWSFGPGNNTHGYSAAGAGLGGLLGARFGRGLRGKSKLAGGLGLLGAIGGGLFGGGKDRQIQQSQWVGQLPGEVPAVGPWNQEAEEAAWKSKFGRLSGGIADLNSRYNTERERMGVLQEAVDSYAPGSGTALAELQALRRSPTATLRNSYFDRLGNQQTALQNSLAAVQGQQADLSGRSGSLWSRFRSKIGMPVDYDGEALRLQAEASRLSNDLRMNEGLVRRLRGGYTGGDPDEIVTQQDLEARLFPTR